jgi:hypothetical protein
MTSQTLHHLILLLLKFHSNFICGSLTCTLFSDSVSKAMNSNMVSRIHKPMEGSWNDYQLYAQPTKIGGQQESD